MFWLKRIKNIWAWSAYHPSSPPEEVGFIFTGNKKPINQRKRMMSEIIKKEEPFI